jgi:putative PIN family toxin of toxin-antitoxin system
MNPEISKIVLDTNILISGYLFGGVPREIIELGRQRCAEILTSVDTEREFIRVLGYPKFGLESDEILLIIQDFKSFAVEVSIFQKIDVIDDDSTDNIFLELVVCGNAEYIVSEDKHLLELKHYSFIEIVTARDYWEIYHKKLNRKIGE